MPLSITHQDIFDIFSVVSGKEKFQIIEMEQTIATAVKKEPFSLMKMLENCLPVRNSQQRKIDKNMTDESPISAIRL